MLPWLVNRMDLNGKAKGRLEDIGVRDRLEIRTSPKSPPTLGIGHHPGTCRNSSMYKLWLGCVTGYIEVSRIPNERPDFGEILSRHRATGTATRKESGAQ